MNTLTLKILAFWFIVYVVLIAAGCSNTQQKPVADMTLQELMQVELN